MVTSEVRSVTQKSGKSGLDKTMLSVAAMGIFGNTILVLITDDVFMHLGQVGSGQDRSTDRVLVVGVNCL